MANLLSPIVQALNAVHQLRKLLVAKLHLEWRLHSRQSVRADIHAPVTVNATFYLAALDVDHVDVAGVLLIKEFKLRQTQRIVVICPQVLLYDHGEE